LKDGSTKEFSHGGGFSLEKKKKALRARIREISVITKSRMDIWGLGTRDWGVTP